MLRWLPVLCDLCCGTPTMPAGALTGQLQFDIAGDETGFEVRIDTDVSAATRVAVTPEPAAALLLALALGAPLRRWTG